MWLSWGLSLGHVSMFSRNWYEPLKCSWVWTFEALLQISPCWWSSEMLHLTAQAYRCACVQASVDSITAILHISIACQMSRIFAYIFCRGTHAVLVNSKLRLATSAWSGVKGIQWHATVSTTSKNRHSIYMITGHYWNSVTVGCNCINWITRLCHHLTDRMDHSSLLEIKHVVQHVSWEQLPELFQAVFQLFYISWACNTQRIVTTDFKGSWCHTSSCLCTNGIRMCFRSQLTLT